MIICDDLLDQAQDITPEVFNYKLQAEQGSLLNTIPTVPAYMMDLMVDWIVEEQGGLAKIAEVNRRKVAKLYAAIDNSNDFTVIRLKLNSVRKLMYHLIYQMTICSNISWLKLGNLAWVISTGINWLVVHVLVYIMQCQKLVWIN